MAQGTRKFVWYREKFEIKKFEIEKGYAVFLGKISMDRTYCLSEREIFEIEGSQYREGTEAATRGVLYEKVFLEISQNWQENTCARASFSINLQA